MADIKNFVRANYRLATKIFLLSTILILSFGTNSFAVKKGYATPVEEITEDMAKTIIDKMNETIELSNEYYFKCTPREFVNAWKNFNWSSLGYGQIYFQNLFFTQFQKNGGYDITIFNFPTDTSMKPIVPEITAKIPTIYGLNSSWHDEIQKVMTTINTSESPTYIGNYIKIYYYNGQLRMYKGTGAEDLSNATPSWYKAEETSTLKPTTDGMFFYCNNMFSLIKEIDLYTNYKNQGYRTYLKNDNLILPYVYEDDTSTNPGDNSGDNSGDNKTLNEIKDKIPSSGDIGAQIENSFSGDVPKIDEDKFKDNFNGIQNQISDKLGLFDYSNFLFSIASGLSSSLLGTGNVEIEMKTPTGKIVKINSKDIVNKNTELKAFLSIFSNTAIIMALVISIQWIINKVKEGDVIYMLDLGDAEMYFYQDMNMM